jgi:hypothetical protein
MIFSRLNVYGYNLYSFLSISDRRNKWIIKNAERPLLNESTFIMARMKQAAKKLTGGKASVNQLATKTARSATPSAARGNQKA